MSYIRFEHRGLGDDRWLEVTPEAFTVHAWALDYCNEQGTDGWIGKPRAHRLVCPVDPSDIPSAFAALIGAGLWEDAGTSYRCPNFLAYGISAEEQTKTREKWAADKRRRRLHDVGNHQLCTARSCASVRNGQAGLTSTYPPVDSTSGQVDDQTKPDQTHKGVWDGAGPPLADAASADITPLAAVCTCPSPTTAVDDPGECIRCRGAVTTPVRHLASGGQ